MRDQAGLYLRRTHFAPGHVERLVGPAFQKPAAVRIHAAPNRRDTRHPASATSRSPGSAADRATRRASSTAPVWCRPGNPTGRAPDVPAASKTSVAMPGEGPPRSQAFSGWIGSGDRKQPMISVPPEMFRIGHRVRARALEEPAVGAFIPRLAGRAQQPQRAQVEAFRPGAGFAHQQPDGGR